MTISTNASIGSSDAPADTLRTDKPILNRGAEQQGEHLFHTRTKKDAIAYYYDDETSCFVIIAAAYDEAGNRSWSICVWSLSSDFIRGILTSIIGGYFFSIRLLHPLRRIADEVTDISARNLARRIGATGGNPKDEWDYLSDTLNQLLNRLQESFEIQGRFIANASHELSTPLTSISSQLEVALQRAGLPKNTGR